MVTFHEHNYKAMGKLGPRRSVFIMKDNRRELMKYEMKLYGKNTVEMEAFLVT